MSIIIANLLAAGLLIAFILWRWSIMRSLIEPGLIFAVTLILLYPVRALVLLYFGTDAIPQYPGILNLHNLRFVSWLSVLGAIGYIAGYQSVMRTHQLTIIKPNTLTFGTNEVLICTALFSGALVGIAYKIATGDYISYLLGQNRNSAFTQIANLLTSLQWPAFLGVWTLFFQGRRKSFFIILFCMVNIVVIPYQFIQGSKTFLSLLMVSVVFAYYWSRGRLPKISILVALFLIIAVVYPFVTNFRDNMNYTYGNIPDISAIDPSLLTEQARQARMEDADETFMYRLLVMSSRFGGMDELYGLVDLVPDRLAYRYGFEYTAFFVNFVPRMVWPSKPTFSRGAVFGEVLGTVTSVTPFPYGEAYWDLGTAGVPLMMAVWGALLATISRIYEHYFRKRRFRFLVAVYFLSEIYWISGSEASMPMIISGIPQQIFILIVVYMGYKVIRRLSQSIGAIKRVPSA